MEKKYKTDDLSLDKLIERGTGMTELKDYGDFYRWHYALPQNAKKSEIKLNLNDDTIEMECHHKEGKSIAGVSYSTLLPEDAISETIRARFDNGVLSVEADKVKNKSKDKHRAIEIE